MSRKLSMLEAVWKAINMAPRGGVSYFEAAGGSWEVFSKTLGWFQVKDKLTPDEQKEIERRFRAKSEAIYGATKPAETP